MRQVQAEAFRCLSMVALEIRVRPSCGRDTMREVPLADIDVARGELAACDLYLVYRSLYKNVCEIRTVRV